MDESFTFTISPCVTGCDHACEQMWARSKALSKSVEWMQRCMRTPNAESSLGSTGIAELSLRVHSKSQRAAAELLLDLRQNRFST